MKKYNQIIKVEVSIDAIAEQLLSTMKEEFAHRVLITETIIDTALSSNTMSNLYNALGGFATVVDFKEGDKVKHNGSDRTVTAVDATRPDGNYVQIKNVYGDDQGWVNHTELKLREEKVSSEATKV